MVAPDRQQPVFAGGVLLFQDVGGDAQVVVGVEQIAGLAVAVLLVAEVDLAQAHVDARGGHLAQRLAHARTSLRARGVAARLADDIERPGPRHDAIVPAHAAFLQRHGIEHRRRNAGALGRQLVGGRRNFLGLDWPGRQRGGQQHAQRPRRHQGWRCHWPFT